MAKNQGVTMKRIFFIGLVLGLLFLSGCAAKPAASIGPIQVFDPWVRVAKSGDNTGSFMLIKNTGSQSDRLLKVECGVSMMTGLHETIMDGDVMKMSEIPALDIPANGQVELKSGGYHVMMMSVSQDLKEGEMMKMTLTFEKAGPLEIEAVIKK
jgi:periplasmic copper chaperone A